METDDDDLCTCMQGMAAGDAAFLFMFHERFASKLTWVVRDMVKSMGRLDIAHDADEIDGLVIDACEVIFLRAGGWHPGGALPWNWASRAIRSRVAAGIGHRLAEFDDEHNGGEADGSASYCPDLEISGVEGEASSRAAGATDLTPETDPLGAEIASLVFADPRAGLLDRAVRAVGVDRSQQICWQYGIQKALKDPSPAVTVGRMFDLEPGNIRQIFRRHRAKVLELIRTDDQFEPLREISWFAA